MLPASDCHEPGLLLVFTRPKSPAYLNDYHDWYNTEHGPARLKLDFVERGYRYQETEDASTWAAMYDLSRVSATTESQYNNLRKHPSSREQSIFRDKVDVLNRKIYKQLSVRGCSNKAAAVITCVSFVVPFEDVDEVNRWYEEQHIDDLSRIPGWQRSRRFQLVDGSVLPGCVELLAIHDFSQQNGLGGPEHMHARYRPWREKVVQLAKSRVNKELRLRHEFRADDYAAPPETSLLIPETIFERRSSLASGFEYSKQSTTALGISHAVLPQVH